MNEQVIFVNVVEMGQDGGEGQTPRNKAYDEPKTIAFILSDMGIELAGRKVKMAGNDVTPETLVTQDNANIAIVPRKIKGGG